MSKDKLNRNPKISNGVKTNILFMSLLIFLWVLTSFNFLVSEISEDSQKRIDELVQQRVAELIPQLGADDWETREKTTDELITIGPRARPAIDKALTHPDAEIRIRAKQIGMILRWKEAFLKRLDKFTTQLRKGVPFDTTLLQDVIHFLGKDESVLILVNLLQDTSLLPNLRGKLANTLANIRTVSLQPILPELLDLIKKESDVNLRVSLIRTLPRAGKDERVIPVLLASLNDPNTNLRVATIYSLCEIGDESTLPALVKLVKDPNQNIRSTVISQVANRFKNETVFTAFLQALKEEKNSSLKCQLIQVLAQFKDKRLLPELITILKTEKDKQVLQRCLGVFPKYRGEPMLIPPLMNLLKTGDPALRTTILNTLRQVGSKGDPAITSALMNLLRSGDPVLRPALLDTLRQLGSQGDPVIKQGLRDLLKNPDPKTRALVLGPLPQLGDKTFIPDLIRSLEPENNLATFKKILSVIETLSNQRFFPQTIPPVIKQDILQKCRKWWEENK